MNQAYISLDTVRLMMPELVLIALASWIYVGGAFMKGRVVWNLLAIAGLCLSGYALYALFGEGQDIAALQNGPLLVDSLNYVSRWIVLLLGFLLVLGAQQAADDELATEYLGSLLLVIAGLLIVCGAGELVLLFAALELISIPTYIMLFLGRTGRRSQEATMKYFFLSIFSSAILLYGFAFLYGVTGKTHLLEIATVVQEGTYLYPGLAKLLPVTWILLLAGLSFKLTAIPFHFYAPDVYQGTTSGNAGLLAVVPKIAGIVVLLRLVVALLPGLEQIGWQIVLVVSLVTMTLGNTMALWQRNIRRLLAYSSIAHAGYMLIGLAVGMAATQLDEKAIASEAFGAMLFYLFVYVLATAGTFLALAYLTRGDRELDDLEELAGLNRSRPAIAAVIAILMFSLAGIPPLAGFWGKLTLLFSTLRLVDTHSAAHLQGWFILLAVVAAINTAIGAAYYLRVVASIYFGKSDTAYQPQGGPGAALSAMFAALLVLLVSYSPSEMMDSAKDAAQSAPNAHRGVWRTLKISRENKPDRPAATQALAKE